MRQCQRKMWLLLSRRRMLVVINPDNNQNEIGRQKEQADSARKQQTDLEGIGISGDS